MKSIFSVIVFVVVACLALFICGCGTADAAAVMPVGVLQAVHPPGSVDLSIPAGMKSPLGEINRDTRLGVAVSSGDVTLDPAVTQQTFKIAARAPCVIKTCAVSEDNTKALEGKRRQSAGATPVRKIE